MVYVAPSVNVTSSSDAEKAPSEDTAKLCRAITFFASSFTLTIIACAAVVPVITAEVVVNVHVSIVTVASFALTGTAVESIRHKVSKMAIIVFFITVPLGY